MPNLDAIKTIVVVMMENRFFDYLRRNRRTHGRARELPYFLGPKWLSSNLPPGAADHDYASPQCYRS